MLEWRHDVKITVVQSGEDHSTAHGFGEFHCSDLISRARGCKTRLLLGLVGLYHLICDAVRRNIV
jgi:hypothetical protein